MNIGIDFEKLTEKAVIVTEQYSRTPNFVIDDMYMAQLNDKAFKCYMFILRQTVGFNRSKTSIATDTFKKYCGIKRDETVYARIRELEQLKLISVTRTTGTTNQITILPNPSQTTVVLTNDTSTVEPHEGSTVEPHGGSTVEPYPIKENIKENIKESANEKNSPDEILNIWTPDLHQLNSWMQRSGLPKINQAQVDELLLEINPHYENKIITGVISAMSYLSHRAWLHDLGGLNCLCEECSVHALPNNQSHSQSLLRFFQDDSLKEFDGFVYQCGQLASSAASQSSCTFVCSDTPRFAHNQQVSQSEQPLNLVMQDCKSASQDQSYNCSLIKASIILSITQLEQVETYYDMQVLDNNNYVTIDGAIHHNSGKTWVGCSSLCDKSWSFPKVPLGYFAPTYPQIRDIFFPTIDEVAFDWGLKTKIYESNKEVDLYYGRQYRSTIICRSMEKPATIVGFKIGHALIDELDVMTKVKAQQAWRKIIARMRYKQAGLLNGIDVATTPEGFKFTHEQFVKEANLSDAKRALYGMIQASTYDNEANLPDDYIASLFESYPPQLISAYLKGQFVNLTSGAVYPDFDRTLNHTDEEIRPNEALLIGMDFNVLKMAAVVYVIRDGKPRALDELVGVRDTPTMADLLIERFPNHEMTIIPDAAGQATSSKKSSESDHAILRQKGLRVEVNSTNPNIKDRINAVNALILNGNGERTLLVNTNKCPRLTETFEQQVYDDFGMPDKKSGLDHVGDAGGYPLAKRFPIIRPARSLDIGMVY